MARDIALFTELAAMLHALYDFFLEIIEPINYT